MKKLCSPENTRDKSGTLVEFSRFSKFEFALKTLLSHAENRTPFRRVRNEGHPDWCRSHVLLGCLISNSTLTLKKLRNLLMNPPMLQVVVKTAPLGTTARMNRSASEKLSSCARVRNNSSRRKFSAEAFEDTERQQRLLTSSLVVLAECLQLSPT